MSLVALSLRRTSLVGLIALTGCLSSFALDRKQAEEYKSRHLPGCGPLPLDVVRAKIASIKRQIDDESMEPGNGEPARGRLPKQAIRERVNSHIGDVRACYDEARLAWPEFQGRVAIKFVIAPDGSVVDAAPESDTSGVRAVGCCIAHAMKGWNFPPPEGGGILIVIYPFVLQVP